MTPRERVILLVSANPLLTQQLVSNLAAAGSHYQLPLAANLAQARKACRGVTPTAILLDESALENTKSPEQAHETLEAAVARLTEVAPVVVVAGAERQADLAFLIGSGAVDFVVREGDFLPLTVGLLQRRVRLAEQAARAELPPFLMEEARNDFGEILRHELNNPLTGILGNAELLLAECKRGNGDPTQNAAAQRLQTIAELAVRLRETVRRLSNAWDTRHDHMRSV